MSTGVLVAVGAAAFEADLLAALRVDGVHVVRRCVDLPDLLATASSRQAEVAVVADTLPGLDAEAVAGLEREGVATVGVVDASDADGSAADVRMRSLGVASIVSTADHAALLGAIASAASRRQPVGETVALAGGPPSGDGTIVAVWGPTGAPGRSTVALGLGAALARLEVSTLVVDADVYGGALAQMLGLLDESSGLLAATREANRGRLGPSGLATSCRQVDPRLRVLTGLPRADRWVEAKSASVRAVLAAARSLTSCTVVDTAFSLEVDEEISYDTTAPRRNGATVEILSQADTVVVVGRADPVGLSRLIRGLSELGSTVPGVEPLVVVNRLRSDLGWSREEIADTLSRAAGVHQLAWLPDDARACDRALIDGRTLPESAPSAPLTRALSSLATSISGTVEPASRPALSRLLRRSS